MSSNLYKVGIGVKPKPEHPFREWQWGYLIVWIYADDFEAAENRAWAIARLLPYELAEEKSRGRLRDYPPGDKRRVACETAEWHASQVGIGMVLDAAPLGADEPPGLFFLK